MKLPFFNNTPIIIAIHGFGKRRSDEFNLLKTVLKPFEIITINLYDCNNENDTEWTSWVAKAEKVIKENHKKQIILLGFSMGGVIATYLSHLTNVKKLILIAPAFEFINPNNINQIIYRLQEKKEESSYVSPPVSFNATFLTLISNLNKAAETVTIPTLIFHGSDDEVINCSISKKYFHKMKTTNKIYCTLENGKHRLLDDKQLCTFISSCIVSFINQRDN